ncbi:hypothetical protein BOX15_Mlig000913g3 [Macrostomum lignano]|uniref:WSC domain-containing protein n=1 Tax=Macrostomum lignano TaxID=282301 RepID=A0A267DKU3_9PLAT|nr:hypothetical protein BOX15_Mlig000913g3 [Macrostomum lignano]
MLRTVLLLFCMSAAIYGALSCSSSKKSEPDAAPETQEDAKEESDLGSPAQSAAAPVVKKDPPKDESTSENPDHNSNSFQAPSEANAALHITEERSTPRSQAEPDEALSAKENPLKDKDVSKKPAKSAAAPVIKKDPPKDESTSKNPVQSFNGIGCYLTTNKVNNEVKLELKQNIKMSHRVCALECARKSPLKRYKYFGLANGENCLCASELPRNAIKVDNPEVHCSYRCPGNHLQSCGGENAAAYFSVSTTLSSMRKDKFEQGAKVYPVIPASDSLKCYENRRKLTKVLQSDDEMSHLVCASECVRRDLYGKKFKYFAITDSDTCFCASTLPTSTEKTKNTYCSYRCPGNHNQSCGADHKIAYFNLSSTTVPPEKDKYEQGMMILPAFTLGNFPLAGCLSLHPGYMIKTVLNKKVMTYRDCAQECVRKDFYETYKYFAIQNIRKCLCAKKNTYVWAWRF